MDMNSEEIALTGWGFFKMTYRFFWTVRKSALQNINDYLEIGKLPFPRISFVVFTGSQCHCDLHYYYNTVSVFKVVMGLQLEMDPA